MKTNIYQDIIKKFNSLLLDQNQFPIPSPFFFNKKKVKAIVLGCDPINFSKKNETFKLSIVFGIGSNDSRYFKDILENLNQIGLHLEDIYVQNVVPFYMKWETSKNNHWNYIATDILPILIKELDSIDKKRNIPVLMTSEFIYKFLLLNESEIQNPKKLYSNLELTPIDKEQNKLGRFLFPLYRHHAYKLSVNEKYKNHLFKFLFRS